MIKKHIQNAVADAMKGIEEKVLAQIITEQAANKVLMLDKVKDLENAIDEKVKEEVNRRIDQIQARS